MFGSFCNYTNKKNTAYTLAEVLVVMSVIMLIILALPPVTKKVFKIKDTRKAHGRYECYWKVNETTGKKELWSYTAEENGREIETNLGASATYCEFKPTANSIYFIMHAVGGGGAGAIVHEIDIDNGGGSITTANVSELEPKQNQVQTTSYLAASNPNGWTRWADWLNQAYKKNPALPWYDSSTETNMKDSFDVGTVDTKQLLRYRTSGNAGSVVSTFLPQLPGNVTLRLYPGKGGSLQKTDKGSGENGEDTKVMYIYDGEAPIEGLLARGGTGGNGTIDSKITYSLVGGPSTDFELSSMASINGKTSGFKDVIEGVEKYDQMQTKVPDNAGDSGDGETQFVRDTNGQIFYEYDDNEGLTNVTRRAMSNWKVITDKIKESYYRKPYFTTLPNCSTAILPSIEVEREGYCDFDMDASSEAVDYYRCAIGQIPSSVLANISKDPTPNGGANWKKFTVKYTYATDLYEVQSNPTDYTTSTPFYDCRFTDTFICKTKLFNVTMHNCTYTKEGNCSNGKKAKSRSKNSLTYTNSINNNTMKCPASGGGDGAVVILW